MNDQEIFDEIKNQGFIAIKTHFNPLGIKTNATIKDIEKILISLQ